MPEASHMGVELWAGIVPNSRLNGIGKLPSITLDAGMTVLSEVPC